MRWYSPDGGVTLKIPITKALPCAQSGAVDVEVGALLRDPEIRVQLDRIPDDVLHRAMLSLGAHDTGYPPDPRKEKLTLLRHACVAIVERSNQPLHWRTR